MPAMTNAEITAAIRTLAEAILEIREEACTAYEYDGQHGYETTVSKGLRWTQFEPKVTALLASLPAPKE